MHQVEPGFAGILAGAGGQHDDGGAGAIGVIAGPDARRLGEGHGVIQVHGFAFGLGAVAVNQHDLGGQAAEQQRVAQRRSYIAWSDHGHPGRRISIQHFLS